MSRDVDPTNSSPSSPAGPTESVRYEWDHPEQPTVAVVESVAATTDRDPEEMPPLYDAVDADALDDLLRTSPDGAGGSIRISFQYAGTDVLVVADGTVSVSQRSLDDR